MWAMNPIPRSATGFDTQCGEMHAPKCPNAKGFPCAGGGETGLGNLEIVDSVAIPADLSAGEWVLGFRWDCEESNQVWLSCSDITVTAAVSTTQA